MPIGVIFILSAAVFYTVAIWSEKFKKVLALWMVIMLSLAFSCDLGGTTIMWFRANSHILTLHSTAGYSALVIMSLHLIWAILAIRKYRRCAELFNHYSIYAWLLWMLAFVSGIPNVL